MTPSLQLFQMASWAVSGNFIITFWNQPTSHFKIRLRLLSPVALGWKKDKFQLKKKNVDYQKGLNQISLYFWVIVKVVLA